MMFAPGFGYYPEYLRVKPKVVSQPSKFNRHNLHWELPIIAFTMLGALALFLYLRGEPDQIESFVLNQPYLFKSIQEHLTLSTSAALIAAAVGIPLGIVLAHSRFPLLVSSTMVVANIGQATPAIGVLVLLALVIGIGPGTALISLVAFSLLPILRNVLTGIREIEPNIIVAAKGMGLTPLQILFKIELPLAIPSIISGFRTALVFSVGVATLATFVNAGGLGEAIVIGVKLNRIAVLLTGAVLVSSLVLLLDWIIGLLEVASSPRGLSS